MTNVGAGLVHVFHHLRMGIRRRQTWQIQQPNRMSENPNQAGTRAAMKRRSKFSRFIASEPLGHNGRIFTGAVLVSSVAFLRSKKVIGAAK